MSTIRFTYTILQYVHDTVAGERLNVGIVLFAPEAGYIRAKIKHNYARLSQAFADFNGAYYRKLTGHIENRINAVTEKLTTAIELPYKDSPMNAKSISNIVLPDDDSALQFTAVYGGITEDPEATLESLYERYVSHNERLKLYYPKQHDDVWKTFRAPLVEHDIITKLKPIIISGESVEYPFQHAWKNSKYHPLEALSMDAEDSDTLLRRAANWVGRTTDLQTDERLGTLYMLIGPPELEKLKPHYIKAINLLHKMPVKHEFVEESEAEPFAEMLSNTIREHDEIHS